MPAKQERWKQRFENFNRADFRLAEAIAWGADGSDTDLFASNKTHDIIQEALVKRFELVFELAWNVLRDYRSTSVLLKMKFEAQNKLLEDHIKKDLSALPMSGWQRSQREIRLFISTARRCCLS